MAKGPLYSQEKALSYTMAVSNSGARRCTEEKVDAWPSEGEGKTAIHLVVKKTLCSDTLVETFNSGAHRGNFSQRRP